MYKLFLCALFPAFKEQSFRIRKAEISKEVDLQKKNFTIIQRIRNLFRLSKVHQFSMELRVFKLSHHLVAFSYLVSNTRLSIMTISFFPFLFFYIHINSQSPHAFGSIEKIPGVRGIYNSISCALALCFLGNFDI